MNILKHKEIPFQTISTYELLIKNYEFQFINQKNSLNENEDSLITYTELNGWHILTMGDTGFVSEKYLLNTYNIKKVHILKVGHHGSKYSSSQEFIDQIKPDISLISVGKNNRFNHPAPEVLERLQDSTTYLTSINGMVKITLKKNLQIETCS